MASSVQHYFRKGLAQSTQRTYGTAMKRFYTFCVKFNIHMPFPATEHLMCCFAAHLADEGLAPQTAKSYLAAVRNMQISLGLPDPRDQSSLPVLKRVLTGISRDRLRRQTPTRPRLPITGPVLAQIHGTLDSSSHPEKVLIRAISSLAFFGFFRLGELLLECPDKYNPTTSLSWGNVVVDDRITPSMVKVHLKHSKCDQLGKGVDIIVGRTDSPVCPVAAIMAYITLRQDIPGPFFISSQQLPVTKSWFVNQVRTILSSLGFPQQEYASHSFRIGAATSAALAGIADSTIQSLGRWQSVAFLQYIRMPRERLACISRQLAETAVQQARP